MLLSFYVEGGELAEVAEPMATAISQWIEETGSSARLVNNRPPETDQQVWDLGVTLFVKKKMKLKDPLTFLYALAKEHKREFAVGIVDKDSGESEEVCFFGFEEGRPDLDEIACYLEL